jgi:hypothetical protein
MYAPFPYIKHIFHADFLLKYIYTQHDARCT